MRRICNGLLGRKPINLYRRVQPTTEFITHSSLCHRQQRAASTRVLLRQPPLPPLPIHTAHTTRTRPPSLASAWTSDSHGRIFMHVCVCMHVGTHTHTDTPTQIQGTKTEASACTSHVLREKAWESRHRSCEGPRTTPPPPHPARFPLEDRRGQALPRGVGSRILPGAAGRRRTFGGGGAGSSGGLSKVV